jgi:hypothetical protein
MAWKGIRPSEFALKIIDELEDEVKRKIIVGFQTVITMSPVMDGAFRGNHRLTVNGQDFAFDPNQLDKNGNSTLSAGLSNLLQFHLGDSVYIQNNAPYAVRLENGWSKQAKSGIYSIAFMNMRTA